MPYSRVLRINISPYLFDRILNITLFQNMPYIPDFEGFVGIRRFQRQQRTVTAYLVCLQTK